LSVVRGDFCFQFFFVDVESGLRIGRVVDGGG